MIVCALHDLAKMNADQMVFTGINAEVKEKSRIGLVGANGSGKTTLLRCLAGIEPLDRGEVFIKKGAKTGLLAQIPVHDPEKTVKQVLEEPFQELIRWEREMQACAEAMAQAASDDRELEQLLKKYERLQQMFEQAGGYLIPSRVAQVSQGLGIPQSMWEQPFDSLSGGEKTKVGLAALMLSEPEILLLDEPTNHLDLPSLEWLENYLQVYPGAVVIVSHDRYFLDRVVNEIWDLEGGKIHRYFGNYSHFVRAKEERILAEFQQYREQEKRIKKMEEAIKRLKEWANRSKPPNEGMHRRAKSMEKALARMERIEKPAIERKKMALRFSVKERGGQDVIRLERVGKIMGERLLFVDADLHIRQGERCAIVGANGTGKTTLFRIILGDLEPDEGNVWIGPSVKIGFMSQAGYEGNPKQTVLEAFREQVAVTEEEARRILARFLFHGTKVFQRVESLSGGERMRLRLAQLMHQDIQTLLLDEPTNHLDIDSREVLEEALAAFPGSVIAISHDRYFLNKLFDSIYWLENGQITHYPGPYDWAKAKREEMMGDDT